MAFSFLKYNLNNIDYARTKYKTTDYAVFYWTKAAIIIIIIKFTMKRMKRTLNFNINNFKSVYILESITRLCKVILI